MSGELWSSEIHYQVLSEASDGRLSPEEVKNLETYGVKHPNELRPEEDDLRDGECVCGELNCEDEYVHWTSGW